MGVVSSYIGIGGVGWCVIGVYVVVGGCGCLEMIPLLC